VLDVRPDCGVKTALANVKLPMLRAHALSFPPSAQKQIDRNQFAAATNNLILVIANAGWQKCKKTMMAGANRDTDSADGKFSGLRKTVSQLEAPW
jgi:hypothetical protein